MSFLSFEDLSINLGLVSSIETRIPDKNYSTFDGVTLILRVVTKSGKIHTNFLRNNNYDDLYKQLNETCFKFNDIYFMRDSILFFKRTSEKFSSNGKARIELTTVDGSNICEFYETDEEAEFKFSINQAILNSKGDNDK